MTSREAVPNPPPPFASHIWPRLAVETAGSYRSKLNIADAGEEKTTRLSISKFFTEED